MRHVSVFFHLILAVPKIVALKAIRLYQRTISPDHGPFRRLFAHGYCKFHPTCSAYMYQAVDELGITRGLYLGTIRIFRCNPWSQGGFDPVPKRK
jgi:putative membrane protein insertion efficiency factor